MCLVLGRDEKGRFSKRRRFPAIWQSYSVSLSNGGLLGDSKIWLTKNIQNDTGDQVFSLLNHKILLHFSVNNF